MEFYFLNYKRLLNFSDHQLRGRMLIGCMFRQELLIIFQNRYIFTHTTIAMQPPSHAQTPICEVAFFSECFNDL